MSAVVAVADVSKRFGRVTALDRVTFALPENTISGLLGRNGAGKTTLMQILTGLGFATSGQVRVFGANPLENDAVLARVCFVKESQRYPDSYQVRHALQAAGIAFPHWDEAFARTLVDDFGLPPRRTVKKLSRGMFSALGIVIGLASRAPLTLFDEAHIGLDANSRQLFYDRLLADYTAHPRTVVLSTHLIDEVSNLLEHVLILNRGRLLIDADADTLRERAVTVSGPVAAVDDIIAGHTELHRETMGALTRTTVLGPLGPAERDRARSTGLEVAPVSLQQFVVRFTNQPALPGPELQESSP
jgi:ABC-2 type transport system ATP-binding protein